MTDEPNRSINISGNANVSGQVASGDHVTQSQGAAVPAPGEAVAALDRVALLLGEHAAELDDPSRARRDLADVREEVESADPDAERLEGALARLGRRTAGVAVLAEAVTALGGALGF